MRIAYFADSLPPRIDGVSRTYINLADTLQEKEIDFCFFSPFKPNDEFLWTDKVEQVSSVPLFVYTDYKIGIPSKKHLYNKLDSFKPDLIHTSSPTYLGILGADYAAKRKIPAVSVYHTDFTSYFKYYKIKKAEKLGWQYLQWFYKQFTKIYAPSLSSCRQLIELGFNNIELWQRGIDSILFSPNKKNHAFRKMIAPNNETILLFTGRLVKEKDIDDLTKIYLKLKQRKVPFRMLIVGEGPSRQELETAMPEAVFTGFLSGNGLAEMYASSDIFVFPSTTETFGNVVLEACASGLPVIGSDKGSVSDLIKHGETGFVCRAKDEYDFADKIIEIIRTPGLKESMSKSARCYAEQFKWNAINGSLINSYKETIENFSKIDLN